MISTTEKLTRVFGIHQFIHWFSIGIIIPILTLFLMSKGLDLFQVAICLSISTVAIFLFELPTGGLADQIGRVKVYLISIFFSLSAISLLLFSDHIILLMAAMGLLGIARSLSTGTIDAWFIDQFQKLSPKGDLQASLAKIEIGITMGLGLGSLLGGVLPMLSVQANLERYTINIIFIICSYLLVALFTIIWIREPKGTAYDGIINGFSNLPVVLKDAFHFGFRNPGIFLLISATAFWGFSISGLEAFWQPQVKTILGSEEQSWIFGILGGGYFFAAALGSIIITPICRFFKQRYAVILFFFRFTMGISFIALAYQTKLWGFGLFYFVLFMQNGMLNSPHQSLFHEIVPSEKRSTLISLESLFMSLGALGGGPMLGWLANTESIRFAWIIAGIVFAGSGICYLLFNHFSKVKKTHSIHKVTKQLRDIIPFNKFHLE